MDPGREIQSSYQSRWTWHLGGEQQQFEEPIRYTARQIKDRFDLPILNSYCEALGIHRADSDFYSNDCLLIEEDLSRWDQQPSNTMPGAEWRKRYL